MRLKNPCEKLERIDCFSSLLLDIVSCYEMDTNFPAAGNIYTDLMSPVVTENKQKHENIERQIGFLQIIQIELHKSHILRHSSQQPIVP